MISANCGLPAHRYTPQVTQRWPRGSKPASQCAFVLQHATVDFSGVCLTIFFDTLLWAVYSSSAPPPPPHTRVKI